MNVSARLVSYLNAIQTRGRSAVWRLLMGAILTLCAASSSRAQTQPASPPSAIAGNPAATNVESGTGELGPLIGLSPDTGIRLGGVLVSNGNYLASGGSAPGTASFNNLFVVGLDIDLDKLLRIPGATVGASLLRFDGQPTNQQAGVITGYNGLPGAPPLDRTELYELWWRQSFFDDRFVVRLGKVVPTDDFDNVVRPIPVQNMSLQIPGVSSLLYTPIFVNPTILGALPGYYNSAYGVTVTLAPTKAFYVSVGIYDGNGARGVQTGSLAGPTFNGYRFQIGEVGTSWLLGSDSLPGTFAVGGWDQTGQLTLTAQQETITQNGTHGVYSFGSQRLWEGSFAGNASSVSGFVQAGANDSRTMIATGYVGVGLTAFGVVPGRPLDSAGIGLAWSWLNQNAGLRSQEALIQVYEQAHVVGDIYLEPALTVVPNPGEKNAGAPAVAFTMQSTILF
jgi:porin